MAALPGSPATRPGRQGGYALMAIMAVVVMASLVAIVDRLDAAPLRLRRTADAGAAMAAAKAALIAHAVSYRDVHATETFGFLPCPDTKGSGAEQTPCGKAGQLSIGLLPYKTLGLPELRDAEGNCLWYAVSGSFKASPKTSPFNWDTRGDISVRSASGATLAAPDDDAGGAAAVIVAAGAPLASQHRGGDGICGADPAQPQAYVESHGNMFIDGSVTDGAGMQIGNDRVVWITSREIFDAVVRRSDFAAFMDEGIAAVASKLGKQRATAGNRLPDNPFGRQALAYPFYEAWEDQFRYLRCAKGTCFEGDDGGRYAAVLLFGGRSASGAPRPGSARGLADYFEQALPVAQGRRFDCNAAPAAFDNTSAATRMTDIALCLAP